MTNSQFARAAALAALVGVFAACEDASTEPGGVAGTYELVAANGESLPAVVFDGETDFGHAVWTAVSGTMTLRSTTFTERVVFRVVLEGADLGENPVVLDGEYTHAGGLLDFDPEDAGSPSFTGTMSGGTLTTLEIDSDFGETEFVWER